MGSFLPAFLAGWLAGWHPHDSDGTSQVIGRPLGEDMMLRVAHALEGRLDFAAQVPGRVRAGRA